MALLSQPHLTALSGTQAKSLAGGELIYKVSGLNSGDIRPYPFGTTLNVTPTLLRTPAEGADTVIWLAASERAAKASGRFFFDRIPRRTHFLPWTQETQQDRQQLWSLCERLTA